jgi:signal transduction histidine kinase
MHRLLALLAYVNIEADTDLALDRIIQITLEITGSRNAMIARLNEEGGTMELRHGAGSEWSEKQAEAEITITTQRGIVAFVAATGNSFMSGDVQNEPQYFKMFETTRSEMAVPIQDRYGRIRGVLNVESERVDAYDLTVFRELETLAEVAAVVINRDDSMTIESALLEIGHALDRAMTEEEIVKGVIRIGSEVLRFQAFSVFVFEPGTESYVLRGSVGKLKDSVGTIAYKKGEGITGSVAVSLEPILTHEPMFDPRWLGRNTDFPGEEIASFLAVPVVYRGRCLAILRALRKVSPNEYIDNRFDENDMTVLAAIAEQMAAALEGVRSINRLVRSERMAAWGELSAKSSHMIGNRVFALKGDVNELRHLLNQPELARNTLEELHHSLEINVERIEEILQDFRDFLTATQINTEPVDINELVETTAREIFPRRSQVQLVVDLDRGLPLMRVDAKRLRRAISELVENSMNFVTEGSLRVATGMATTVQIRKAHLSPAKRFMRIEVEDTGPGIKDEQKLAIFQPFLTGRVKGMGLGLSIVKGIADAHGGAIFEEGEEGKGAKFVILLPFEQA